MIQKYNPDEARNLKAYKELPETAKINDVQIDDDNDLDGKPITGWHSKSPDLLQPLTSQFCY